MHKINDTDNSDSSNRRVLLGVALIFLGGILVLTRLNLIPGFVSDILISWQMLLVGIGVLSLASGKKTTGIILITIGTIFIISDNVNIPYELRNLGWPLILISIGFIILISHSKKKSSARPKPENGKYDINYFDDFVVFGGQEIVINSQSFVGGKTTSLFGGSEYDFREARLSENGAVIECTSIFGGCGFKVPPDWTVKNEVTAIFGAFSDKRGTHFGERSYDTSKVLVLKGFTAFGGIEIKY